MFIWLVLCLFIYAWNSMYSLVITFCHPISIFVPSTLNPSQGPICCLSMGKMSPWSRHTVLIIMTEIQFFLLMHEHFLDVIAICWSCCCGCCCYCCRFLMLLRVGHQTEYPRILARRCMCLYVSGNTRVNLQRTCFIDGCAWVTFVFMLISQDSQNPQFDSTQVRANSFSSEMFFSALTASPVLDNGCLISNRFSSFIIFWFFFMVKFK